MELEILKSVSGLGVGAVFGIVVYLMSLRQQKDARDQLVSLNHRLIEDNGKLLSSYHHLLECDISSRDENTKAFTRLTTLIERLEAKL